MATDTQVIVSGAGPVGLVVALDLARRGVRSTIVETRQAGEPPSVKCNHVAARTMEAFRRLGFADVVRDSGLPADYPNDCVYRTSVTQGHEITRIAIPARAERWTDFAGPDTWWPTPEPPHRINQIYLEPLIFAQAAAHPLITIRNRTELIEATQDDAGVTVTVRDLPSGATETLTALYLVGCDGGRSRVRSIIGAKLSGDAVVQRVQSTYIRAPKLLEMMQGRPGWMNLSLNPRRSGNTVAIDGRETWLIHNYLYEHEEDFDAIDRDASIRTILGVGDDFTYEVISKEDWIGRRLVADKFRDRRIFICGDSAHLWVPYAGFGMNAGIADAMNLTWLLAATVNGWGGAHLLDAYEAERLPITEQVSHFAMNHALSAIAHRRAVPEAVEHDGAEGEAARAALGAQVYALNVQQYCCGGLNFGYFYPDSPIIAYDGEQQPGYSMAGFEQSTVPGCRTPHFWRRNGNSAYDDFGADYTLLRFDPTIDVAPLAQAAAAAGMPLKLLDIAPDERTAVYRHALLVSRPDLHVGWRGDALPGDVVGLVDQLRGARG
ncbi:FAD-dependent oxidoreductase [Sphingomonas lycopersici]|uniref:FAD-dependent oxidoreductase n=1 Tax=Sphingomonas lycopersici TaxID=2951807 RepID=A0AA41ZEB7_9SPHN|nr:FAD-dependent oxidoreductase [Sphingomonas lycopersici]MCW6535344.1 FAD-dependent oxidoreductase [Sphingomonas lycopersici]